jgi:aldose 1-epimerase
MAYRVSTTTAGSRTVYHLHDDTSGASASVLPSFGFNLFDLKLPVAGQVRRVVDAAPDFAEKPSNPGRNGTPILFPYPNRIKDARYTFEGKSYQLPVNNGPNSIHGFAIQANWDVVDHKAESDAATITGRYQLSKQSPEHAKDWPADAILQIRYRLSGKALELQATVTNPSNGNFPFGFGIHPYFLLPFDRSADQAQTQVVLPASKFWVLKDFIPTGERAAVDARLDFRKGQPIKGLKLDDVLTDLIFDANGRATCRLIDEPLKAEFRLSFDKEFRELVAYTPPGPGGVIALEPYTQATDAINLQTRAIDGGLRVLKHGEHADLAIRFETVG